MRERIEGFAFSRRLRRICSALQLQHVSRVLTAPQDSIVTQSACYYTLSCATSLKLLQIHISADRKFLDFLNDTNEGDCEDPALYDSGCISDNDSYGSYVY